MKKTDDNPPLFDEKQIKRKSCQLNQSAKKALNHE